jgi:hypothetical protein
LVFVPPLVEVHQLPSTNQQTRLLITSYLAYPNSDSRRLKICAFLILSFHSSHLFKHKMTSRSRNRPLPTTGQSSQTPALTTPDVFKESDEVARRLGNIRTTVADVADKAGFSSAGDIKRHAAQMENIRHETKKMAGGILDHLSIIDQANEATQKAQGIPSDDHIANTRERINSSSAEMLTRLVTEKPDAVSVLRSFGPDLHLELAASIELASGRISDSVEPGQGPTAEPDSRDAQIRRLEDELAKFKTSATRETNLLTELEKSRKLVDKLQRELTAKDAAHIHLDLEVMRLKAKEPTEPSTNYAMAFFFGGRLDDAEESIQSIFQRNRQLLRANPTVWHRPLKLLPSWSSFSVPMVRERSIQAIFMDVLGHFERESWDDSSGAFDTLRELHDLLSQQSYETLLYPVGSLLFKLVSDAIECEATPLMVKIAAWQVLFVIEDRWADAADSVFLDKIDEGIEVLCRQRGVENLPATFGAHARFGDIVLVCPKDSSGRDSTTRHNHSLGG